VTNIKTPPFSQKESSLDLSYPYGGSYALKREKETRRLEQKKDAGVSVLQRQRRVKANGVKIAWANGEVKEEMHAVGK